MIRASNTQFHSRTARFPASTVGSHKTELSFQSPASGASRLTRKRRASFEKHRKLFCASKRKCSGSSKLDRSYHQPHRPGSAQVSSRITDSIGTEHPGFVNKHPKPGSSDLPQRCTIPSPQTAMGTFHVSASISLPPKQTPALLSDEGLGQLPGQQRALLPARESSAPLLGAAIRTWNDPMESYGPRAWVFQRLI